MPFLAPPEASAPSKSCVEVSILAPARLPRQAALLALTRGGAHARPSAWNLSDQCEQGFVATTQAWLAVRGRLS
jgi:hypothetical protein